MKKQLLCRAFVGSTPLSTPVEDARSVLGNDNAERRGAAISRSTSPAVTVENFSLGRVVYTARSPGLVTLSRAKTT
jgi:hypothetical protein